MPLCEPQYGVLPLDVEQATPTGQPEAAVGHPRHPPRCPFTQFATPSETPSGHLHGLCVASWQLGHAQGPNAPLAQVCTPAPSGHTHCRCAPVVQGPASSPEVSPPLAPKLPASKSPPAPKTDPPRPTVPPVPNPKPPVPRPEPPAPTPKPPDDVAPLLELPSPLGAPPDPTAPPVEDPPELEAAP